VVGWWKKRTKKLEGVERASEREKTVAGRRPFALEEAIAVAEGGGKEIEWERKSSR
jgi:hypothetical protein